MRYCCEYESLVLYITTLQAGGFKLPFITLGGVVLLFTIPCALLVRKISEH